MTMEEPVILNDLLERTKQALDLTPDIAQRKNLDRVIEEIRIRAKRGRTLKDAFQRGHGLSEMTTFEVCMIEIGQQLTFDKNTLPAMFGLKERLGSILQILERTISEKKPKATA